MEALCGHSPEHPSETCSSTLPLCEPAPQPIEFPGEEFVVTGKFALGTRKKVFAAIESLGGIPNDSYPTHGTRYLLIGTFASRDWANTNFGRKIERAIELRDRGSGISIVAEEHWRRFIPTIA
jgi:NAD-dependent DNA ligase